MTDQSNMQKMHIPSEWVEVASRAAAAANNDDPDFLGYRQDKPNWQLWSPCINAALTAVIPLIREDAQAERDRYREALGAICRKHDEMVWGEDYEHVAVSNFADETARTALGFDGLPK